MVYTNWAEGEPNGDHAGSECCGAIDTPRNQM